MKRLNTILLILFLSLHVFGQDRIFPELDFDTNSYQLYVSRSYNVIPKQTSQMFIVNNRDTIQKLADTWTGEKTNNMLLCGYNYDIYIVSDNKILTKINYNSECNQAVSRNGTINVKDNPFERMDKSLTFSEYTLRSDSAEVSRAFLKRASAMEGIFVPRYYHYQWKDYDGSFLLTIKGDADKRDKEHSYEVLRDAIYKHYADDKFLIDLTYTSVEDWRNGVEYHVSVYCNEDFWNKFDMIEGKFGWSLFYNFDVYIFGDNKAIEEIKGEFSSERL